MTTFVALLTIKHFIMKKIILLVLLALISVSASARKSYVDVYVKSTTSGESGTSYLHSTSNIYLTGDVPKGITDCRYSSDCFTHYDNNINDAYFNGSIGDILNRLSELGYEVELMNDNHYLLSKETSSGQTISKGDVNTDGEVNIADVNEVISLILGLVREHPELLEQIKNKP